MDIQPYQWRWNVAGIKPLPHIAVWQQQWNTGMCLDINRFASCWVHIQSKSPFNSRSAAWFLEISAAILIDLMWSPKCKWYPKFNCLFMKSGTCWLVSESMSKCKRYQTSLHCGMREEYFLTNVHGFMKWLRCYVNYGIYSGSVTWNTTVRCIDVKIRTERNISYDRQIWFARCRYDVS